MAVGVLSEGDGGSVVWATLTGGTITTDLDWEYHAFTAGSDSLVVVTAGLVEYLVVGAGGQGGGYYSGGGGGGGAVRNGVAWCEAGTLPVVVVFQIFGNMIQQHQGVGIADAFSVAA